MRTLALMLALAVTLVSPSLANDCATSFCRTKVAAVHHGQFTRNYHHGVFSVNYGAQTSGQFWDDADLLAAAINKGVGAALDERGIGARPASAQGSIDLGKCLRCHGSQSKREDARGAYEMPDDASMSDIAVVSMVFHGLREGMAGPQYANLTEQQRQVWFDEADQSLRDYVKTLKKGED